MTEIATPPPEPKSRKGCWIAALLGIGVLAVGAIAVMLFLFAMVIAGMQGGSHTKIARGSVLEIGLSGTIAESPPEIELGGLFGLVTPPSLWDLRRSLEHAAGDRRITGVLLDINTATVGWATAQEITAALDRFREESGKPVTAILQADLISDIDYFLATGADQIWVNPQVAATINGLVSEAMFSRGSLEKLHIEPHVIMYKEYKSAGEQFANYEMSEPMREALTAVLEDLDAVFRDRVGERRGLSPGEIESWMARGMAAATDLQQAGLVDELGYLDQVQSSLVEQTGIEEYSAVGLAGYAASLDSPSDGARIAVVFGEGAIVSQDIESPFPFFGASVFSGPRVAGHIRDAAEDSRVRAILFRVNSPGGSAVGSDLVRREIERARAAGKPVIVSMSDVAGSGGYWVSMEADEIVAHPATITGSIGVVFQQLNLDGLMEWLGTNVDRVQTAPNADLLAAGPWQEGDREAVETWMDAVYGNFTRAVAHSRGLELATVERIARGRIWSGADALDRGLVDRLGGWQTALETAREAAGIGAEERVSLVLFPRPKTLWQSLMEDDWTGVELGAMVRARLAAFLEGAAQPRVEARMPEVRTR